VSPTVCLVPGGHTSITSLRFTYQMNPVTFP
jgi:hypothetical protein